MSTNATPRSFPLAFQVLTGHAPMRWQYRLFERMLGGNLPDAVDLPTGLGKTLVMAIWLIARALAGAETALPRRLVHVVDRRSLQTALADRAILPPDEADGADQAFPRPPRELHAHPDRRGADRYQTKLGTHPFSGKLKYIHEFAAKRRLESEIFMFNLAYGF